MRRRRTGLLLVLILVAAACGGAGVDGEASTGADDGRSPDVAAPDPPAETDDDTDPPTEAGDGTDGSEAAPLTASYRGVTEDRILVGVAMIDFARLQEFGVDIEGIDPMIWAPAWAQAFNERGGARGRMMEIVVSTFLPVGSTESDRTCTELTQDEEVFVVLGAMLNENPLCVTELNQTAYVGMFGLSADRQERSIAPFFASEMAVDAQRRNALRALIEQGTFDGVDLGVYWEEGDENLATEVVLPLLDDAGINVVETVTQLDYGDDSVAAAGAIDSLFAALEGSGADMYLNISGLVQFNRAIDRNRPNVPFVLLNGQMTSGAIISTSGYDPDVLVDAIGVTAAKPTPDEWRADPGWQQCLDEINRSGLGEFVAQEMSDGLVGGLGQACQAFRLLEHLLLTADPVLTPDALRAAADATGELRLPGMGAGSLGPGKYSVGDEVRYYTYDPELQIMVPEGDPIVVVD